MSLRKFIEKIRKREAEGAMLFYDGALIQNPEWDVQPGHISFVKDNCRYILWDKSDGEPAAEAEKDLRARLKVVIPVVL